jgi:hypothetical protein
MRSLQFDRLAGPGRTATSSLDELVGTLGATALVGAIGPARRPEP